MKRVREFLIGSFRYLYCLCLFITICTNISLIDDTTPDPVRKKPPLSISARAWFGMLVRMSDHRHDVKAEYLLGLCGGHGSPPDSHEGWRWPLPSRDHSSAYIR